MAQGEVGEVVGISGNRHNSDSAGRFLTVPCL